MQYTPEHWAESKVKCCKIIIFLYPKTFLRYTLGIYRYVQLSDVSSCMWIPVSTWRSIVSRCKQSIEDVVLKVIAWPLFFELYSLQYGHPCWPRWPYQLFHRRVCIIWTPCSKDTVQTWMRRRISFLNVVAGLSSLPLWDQWSSYFS